MKVRELIAALEAMPPDADIYCYNAYGSGRREFNAQPKVETICLHKSNGSPRYESELRHLGNSAKNWTPDRQVVAL